MPGFRLVVTAPIRLIVHPPVGSGGGGHGGPPPPKHRTPTVPTIIPAKGRRLELPWAPNGAVIDGITPAWQTVARTERSPLLLSAGGQLKTWHATIPIGHEDWTNSVQPHLDYLEQLAGDGTVITFAFGGPERGRWRITGAPITILQRTPHFEPSYATVDLTLTRVSDLTAHVGPVTGGHGIPAAQRGRPYPGAPKHYTVRKGDTLWKIAARLYGKAEAWPIIADANRVRDARSHKLPVGKRLRIP